MPAIVVATGCKRIGNSKKTAENTAGISVEHAETDKRQKTAAERTADRGESEQNDRNNEQPSQRQDPRQQPGQRNGNDLGDQIRRLDPTHRIPRYREGILDRGQRSRDHLDVEDRHEHAEAHQDEA